jgi:glyceraldehyde 3-phosphate dehydrogenase
MIRVAINGFGRIGRQILQAGFKDKRIEWVAVNDLTDTKTLAHLFKYDSVYGVSPLKIKTVKGGLELDGKKIKMFAEKDPSKLPWKELKVDIVVESTGFFRDRAGAMKHIKAGAKKVLITAAAKDPDATLIMGVNEHKYKKKDKIISKGSCTTTCVTPMIKVLHDAFKIKHAYMVTGHAYTGTQRLVDAPHKDLREARAAAVSLIPAVTGAAKLAGKLIPSLDGKIDGIAWRIPVPSGSIVQVTAEVSRKVTVEQVNEIYKKAAKKLGKVFQYTKDPIVTHDIVKNEHSCIFDSLLTRVVDGTLVTVSGWYDNEWGYSCRVVDMIKKL